MVVSFLTKVEKFLCCLRRKTAQFQFIFKKRNDNKGEYVKLRYTQI
jgi:hypothetical protein